VKRLLPFCLLMLAVLAVPGCGARAAGRSWQAAVAAYTAGDAQAAEIAAEKAAAQGGAAFAARRDFLLAATALQRSLAEEARSSMPGAAFAAYDRALAAAIEARGGWRQALLRRDEDWPAARRNLERVEARIAALQSKREAALRDPSASRPPPAQPEPQAANERLLERLGKQELQKQILRRSSATLSPGSVEQDW